MAEKKTSESKASKESKESKPKVTRSKKIKAAPLVRAEVAPRQYEAMFLFPPPGTVDTEGMIATARGIIERHGGKIILIKKWDERKISYEIKHQKRGLYIVAYYSGPGASVAAIERDVNLSENILRVLITTADHLSEKEMNAVEPQPIQPREERAPWDRPDFNRPARRDDRAGGDRPPRRDEATADAGIGAE
jgi:small subunit ribosomal protein S6